MKYFASLDISTESNQGLNLRVLPLMQMVLLHASMGAGNLQAIYSELRAPFAMPTFFKA